MGRSYLWQYSLAWLYLDGNAYWFIQYDEAGQPLEIWPLPAQEVEIVPGDGARFVDFYRYSANGRAFEIASEYIIHFQFPNPFDVFRGLSPLVAAMLPVDSDLAMAFWNGAFFGRDNVMPSSIINLKPAEGMRQADLEADMQAIKADLRENYGAARRKSLLTSYDAVQAVLLGWSAKDMDFIAGRQFTKEEIYQILGVPSGLLDKNATEANAALADKIFKEKTIWPVMCMLAEQLTAQLVVPAWGADCEAAFEDIRPANRQLELQEVAAAGGYLTRDEIRLKYWQLPALPDSEGASLGGPAAPGPAAATPTPNPLEALRAAELKRWQDHAIHALKRSGNPAQPFHTEYLEPERQSAILNALTAARSLPAIKAAFETPRPLPAVPARTAEGELQAALADYLQGLETRVNSAAARTDPHAAA
jgi:HK97 family phage portal protein